MAVKEEAAFKEVLQGCELFSWLTQEQLEKVAELCQRQFYQAGETIFSEGNPALRAYVIEEGKVAMDIGLRFGAGTQRRATIAVVTRGGVLGWSTVAGATLLTSSARCMEPTKVLAIDGPGLHHVFEADPQLGYRVMLKLVDIVHSRFEQVRETLAHILSIASHDLKAPLHAVQSYHQVILGGFAGEVSPRQRTMLLRSHERIDGLLNLIDDILDISRLEAGEFKKEPTSLIKVVQDSLNNVLPQAQEKEIKLEADLPPRLPEIYGSPNRLQQVFTNLLGNAVRYTPKQGRVTVRIREGVERIEVEVMDTGVGIPAAELPHIFDDFYRGSTTEAGGAGLGLAIAKKIVEAHGGRIWAESPYPESEKGSKFTFVLPKQAVMS